MMSRIIFIEGVSGVGKTTTATLLSKKLQGMGYKADCYLEGDNSNPLDPFNGTYPPKISMTDFFATYKQCWQSFMGNDLDRDFVILDGTLLHYQINDLIRGYSASDVVIVEHLSDLLSIIEPLTPILFYLSSHNVSERLIQARISRKQSAPSVSSIAFWENRKRIDLLALERLPIETHIIDVDFATYEPDNEFASKFYASLGFVETGVKVDDEAVAKLKL